MLGSWHDDEGYYPDQSGWLLRASIHRVSFAHLSASKILYSDTARAVDRDVPPKKSEKRDTGGLSCC